MFLSHDSCLPALSLYRSGIILAISEHRRLVLQGGHVNEYPQVPGAGQVTGWQTVQMSLTQHFSSESGCPTTAVKVGPSFSSTS